MPVLAKDIELPTYTGFPVLRAIIFASRVVKSRFPLCVYSGVLRVSDGLDLFGIAYTKLPIEAEAAESVVADVKKSRSEVRLSVSWR